MTTRRRFFSILAGAAVLPAFGMPASANVAQWRGIALGAEARIILDHPDADRLIAVAVSEIQRLENIFSLYRSNSQLSRLNRNGSLQNPAFEMVELLSICSNLNARTNGAFDPSIQPLWALHAAAYSAGSTPDAKDISRTLEMTGWQHIRFSPDEIHFERRGMALTLNGIAQGFIADKVTDLFRLNGVENVLVNTGEIAALGVQPDGREWQVELKGFKGRHVTLRGTAVATSAPLGTTFDAGGTVGHILDPRTGYPGGIWESVSVISNSAAEADGLSTAFCLMTQPEISAAKGQNEVYLKG